MKYVNDRGHTWDTCSQCGKDLRLTSAGRLIMHGPRNNRCPGSGHLGQCVMGWIAEANQRTDSQSAHSSSPGVEGMTTRADLGVEGES